MQYSKVLFCLKTHQIHQKRNLWKLKEVDAALEGEGFGHGVGGLVVAVVVVVVAAVLVIIVQGIYQVLGVSGRVELRRAGTRSSQSATRLLYR